MSAPATKAFSPAPVRIMAFILLFSSASLSALLNSLIVELFRAFNLEGLFIVMILVESSMSIRMFLKLCYLQYRLIFSLIGELYESRLHLLFYPRRKWFHPNQL